MEMEEEEKVQRVPGSQYVPSPQAAQGTLSAQFKTKDYCLETRTENNREQDLKFLAGKGEDYQYSFYDFLVKIFCNNIESGNVSLVELHRLYKAHEALDTKQKKNTLGTIYLLQQYKHVDSVFNIMGKNYLVMNKEIYEFSGATCQEFVYMVMIIALDQEWEDVLLSDKNLPTPLINKQIKEEFEVLRKKIRSHTDHLSLLVKSVSPELMKIVFEKKAIFQLFGHKSNEKIFALSTYRKYSYAQSVFEDALKFVPKYQKVIFKIPNISNTPQTQINIFNEILSLFYYKLYPEGVQYTGQSIGNCYMNSVTQTFVLRAFVDCLQGENPIGDFLTHFYSFYQYIVEFVYVQPRYFYFEMINQHNYPGIPDGIKIRDYQLQTQNLRIIQNSLLFQILKRIGDEFQLGIPERKIIFPAFRFKSCDSGYHALLDKLLDFRSATYSDNGIIPCMAKIPQDEEIPAKNNLMEDIRSSQLNKYMRVTEKPTAVLPICEKGEDADELTLLIETTMSMELDYHQMREAKHVKFCLTQQQQNFYLNYGGNVMPLIQLESIPRMIPYDQEQEGYVTVFFGNGEAKNQIYVLSLINSLRYSVYIWKHLLQTNPHCSNLLKVHADKQYNLGNPLKSTKIPTSFHNDILLGLGLEKLYSHYEIDMDNYLWDEQTARQKAQQELDKAKQNQDDMEWIMKEYANEEEFLEEMMAKPTQKSIEDMKARNFEQVYAQEGIRRVIFYQVNNFLTNHEESVDDFQHVIGTLYQEMENLTQEQKDQFAAKIVIGTFNSDGTDKIVLPFCFAREQLTDLEENQLITPEFLNEVTAELADFDFKYLDLKSKEKTSQLKPANKLLKNLTSSVLFLSSRSKKPINYRSLWLLQPAITAAANANQFHFKEEIQRWQLPPNFRQAISNFFHKLMFMDQNCSNIALLFRQGAFQFSNKSATFGTQITCIPTWDVDIAQDAYIYAVCSQNTFVPAPAVTTATTLWGFNSHMHLYQLSLTNRNISRMMNEINPFVIMKKSAYEMPKSFNETMDERMTALKVAIMLNNTNSVLQILFDIQHLDLIKGQKEVLKHDQERIQEFLRIALSIPNNPVAGRAMCFWLLNFYQIPPTSLSQENLQTFILFYYTTLEGVPTNYYQLLKDKLCFLETQRDMVITSLFSLYFKMYMPSHNPSSITLFQCSYKEPNLKQNYISWKDYNCITNPLFVIHQPEKDMGRQELTWDVDNQLQNALGLYQSLITVDQLFPYLTNTALPEYQFLQFVFQEQLNIVKKEDREYLVISLLDINTPRQLFSFEVRLFANQQKNIIVQTLEQYAVLFYFAVQMNLQRLLYFLVDHTTFSFQIQNLESVIEDLGINIPLHLNNTNFILMNWQKFKSLPDNLEWPTINSDNEEQEKFTNFYVAMNWVICECQQFVRQNQFMQNQLNFDADTEIQPQQEAIIRDLEKSFYFQKDNQVGKKNSFQIRTGMGKSTVISPLFTTKVFDSKYQTLVFVTYQDINRNHMGKIFWELFSNMTSRPINIYCGDFYQVNQHLYIQACRDYTLDEHSQLWKFQNSKKLQEPSRTVVILDFQELVMNMELYKTVQPLFNLLLTSPMVLDEFDSYFTLTVFNKEKPLDQKELAPKQSFAPDTKVINQNINLITEQFNQILDDLKSEDKEKIAKWKDNIIFKLMLNFAAYDPKIQFGPFTFQEVTEACSESQISGTHNFIQVKPRKDGIIQCQDDYQTFFTKYVFTLFYYFLYPYIRINDFRNNSRLVTLEMIKNFFSEKINDEQAKIISNLAFGNQWLIMNIFFKNERNKNFLPSVFNKQVQFELKKQKMSIEKNCYDFLKFVYSKNTINSPVVCFSGTDFSNQFQLLIKQILGNELPAQSQNIFFSDHEENATYKEQKEKEDQALQAQLINDYLFNVSLVPVPDSYYDQNGICKLDRMNDFLREILSNNYTNKITLSKKVHFLIDPNGVLFSASVSEVIKKIQQLGKFDMVCSAKDFYNNYKMKDIGQDQKWLIYFPIGYTVGVDLERQNDAVEGITMLVKLAENNSNQTDQKMFWQAISRSRFSNFGIPCRAYVNQARLNKPPSAFFQNQKSNQKSSLPSQTSGKSNQDIKRQIFDSIKFFIIPEDRKADAKTFLKEKFFLNSEPSVQEVDQGMVDFGAAFNLSDYLFLIDGVLKANQYSFLNNNQFRILATQALFRNATFSVEPYHYIDKHYIFQEVANFAMPNPKELLRDMVLEYNQVSDVIDQKKMQWFKLLEQNDFFGGSFKIDLNKAQQQMQQQQQQSTFQVHQLQSFDKNSSGSSYSIFMKNINSILSQTQGEQAQKQITQLISQTNLFQGNLQIFQDILLLLQNLPSQPEDIHRETIPKVLFSQANLLNIILPSIARSVLQSRAPLQYHMTATERLSFPPKPLKLSQKILQGSFIVTFAIVSSVLWNLMRTRK